MARKVLSDSEVQAIVKAELSNADGQSSALANARAENMDYYQGNPFGNEIEGRSSVVSSDVRDTIEWILPTLIRIFCSGEDVVAFEPETEEDVDAAKQATEYVNFIWNSDNRGFLNTYSWFKDALLQKNGFLKIWWDTTEKTKRERYSGLDDISFTALVNDKDVEVSEHTENKTQILVPDPQTGQPTEQEITTHDLVITRKIRGGRVCVVPVPPEEFLISRDARDIESARMVAHRVRRTLSDLRAQGVKQDIIDTLSGDESSVQNNQEAIARNTVEDQTPGSPAIQNEAMREVWVTEAYIRVDADGDGIAEMRKVEVAGPGAELLSNEAWDAPRPIVSLTTIIMPHRFWGLAVADLIKDIQLIKSTLLRQYLDNLYLRNNQREEVIEANIIDPSEVLSSAPGRKIRIKNGPAIFPIVVPEVGSAALEGLNYLDQVKENRTGSSARTQGLGANQLHDTAQGERMLMSAAMGKIELIARVLGETGVRDAFRLILKLVSLYQDQARTIQLTGKWVEMNPAQWNSDMNLKVSVGIGIGDRDQQLAHAQLLGHAQAEAAQLGFVSGENFKNTAELMINGMGLKGVERFFSFPSGDAGKQAVKIPPKNAGQQQNPQLEMALKQADVQGKVQIAQMQTKAKVQTDQHLNEVEAQRDTAKFNQEMQLEAFKAKMTANVDEIVAHIRAAGQIAAAQVAAKASDGADAEAREAAGESAAA